MNYYSKSLLIVALAAITALTLFLSCEDSISVKDTPPQSDNQNSAPFQKSLEASQQDEKPRIIEGEYIVIFENQWNREISEQAGRQADLLREEILQSHQILADSVMNRYRYAIKGFAAKLSVEQAEALKNDRRIARVSPNAMLQLAASSEAFAGDDDSHAFTALSSHTGNWGVNRVGGPLDGTGLTAWVLDTGIDLDHPDLNVDVQNSASFIATEPADDGNGHGTHVAGIIASNGQTTGIQGVASGATVIAIKVCHDDPQLGCPVNSILNGVDFVSINAIPDDIVNMSFGGPDPNENLIDIDNAVINAADNGVRFTIAAGNNRMDAADFTPARVVHPNTWTVSAFRQGDEFVQIFDWNTPNCNENQSPNIGSNFGNPPINYTAPSENILSLWRNGGTRITCGTSMAAPHVAGILLATGEEPVADGTVSNDPSAPADHIASTYEQFSVSISGPSNMFEGSSDTFTANVSGGEPPYSYQWFYRHQSESNWTPTGTNSSDYVHTAGEPSGEYVKVVVTDNQTYSEEEEDEHFFTIIGMN